MYETLSILRQKYGPEPLPYVSNHLGPAPLELLLHFKNFLEVHLDPLSHLGKLLRGENEWIWQSMTDSERLGF